MVTIEYKDKFYDIPDSWDELNPKQFRECVEVVSMPEEDDSISALRILSVLTNTSVIKFPAEVVVKFLPFIDWVFDGFEAEKNLLPWIKVPKKLYGPAANFENFTAIEFHYVDQYYMDWKSDGTAEMLLRFVASIYRPAKRKYDLSRDPDGDRREIFNPNLVSHNVSAFRKVHIPTMLGIVLQYESWRKKVEKYHPRIFDNSVSPSINYTIDAGWFGVFRSIAVDGKYGTIDDIERMPFNTMLLELEFSLDEAANIKKKNAVA